MFIWERPDWPHFRWSRDPITAQAIHVAHAQGELSGRIKDLGIPLRAEASLEATTLDVIKSSEIEGEHLDADQVRSSVARRLGLARAGLPEADRRIDGIVEMIMDATDKAGDPLTADRLFNWHASLFPTGRSGLEHIRVAAWRDDSHGPMQVVSGPAGRETVHYQAPPATRVPAEMGQLLDWFATNDSPPLIKAGIAHLWFVTIHPFDDGNGRIARAIADLAIARSANSRQRYFSMSAAIRKHRKSYYAILEATQRGDNDITAWLAWFFSTLEESINTAHAAIEAALQKARVFAKANQIAHNERQRKMLNLLLDGFEGKLSTSKWAQIAKCSQDTAKRDIDALIADGLLTESESGGRSKHYLLQFKD